MQGCVCRASPLVSSSSAREMPALQDPNPKKPLPPHRPQCAMNLRRSLERLQMAAGPNSLKLLSPVLLVVVRSQLHPPFCAGQLQPGHSGFGGHCNHCRRAKEIAGGAWSLKARKVQRRRSVRHRESATLTESKTF